MESLLNVLWFFAGLWCARVVYKPDPHYVNIHYKWADFLMGKVKEATFEARLGGKGVVAHRHATLDLDSTVIDITIKCEGNQFASDKIEKRRDVTHGL